MVELDKPIHIESEKASGGVKRHGVRYVLIISMVLAIVALAIVWGVMR